MLNKQKILIIGGTSAIAEQCARQWLSQGMIDAILVGRNQEKLERIVNDLRVRFPQSKIDFQLVDFLSISSIQECINNAYLDSPIDIALIAHGTLPDQILCENKMKDLKQAIEINAFSPVVFAESILNKMIQLDSGKLAVIGSVAGDRGRKSNYVYGASKAFIDRYVEGMQHRLALIKSSVSVTLIKPGPTATPMTEEISGKGKFASPEQVAKEIVKGVLKAKRTIYTPKKWAIIMFVIRHLPFFLFKKMDI
ncbi:SDR family NAD(P)-dependent oxidoreductase [Acinetobacter equi]|uniref:Short-chain dehydrogenase n=1 Tax=Acinetobacter equi TaxID=1324350 RepID=A0A0N9VP32_9GAMM|nr:SDR family NAD(P)-dependent oxidoreductase [Acinetobacter equi]ALH95127.1 short-chain dehydrogenase [Acinetobacter equi]